MPKVAPIHSVLQNVHHNNSNCDTRNNIERENIRKGTGGKRLCERCDWLNRHGR